MRTGRRDLILEALSDLVETSARPCPNSLECVSRLWYLLTIVQKQADFTEAGDARTSGNGSIMRNGAVPIFYAKEGNIDAACECAYKQSKTTHQGEEAAECCRLLTFVTMKFIEGEGKDFLNTLGDKFRTNSYSGMQCLIFASLMPSFVSS